MIWLSLLNPMAAHSQPCEPVMPGDQVKLDVEAPFLHRLWVRRDFVQALFTSTVSEEGAYWKTLGDSLLIATDLRVTEEDGFATDHATAIPLGDVRRFRKRCEDDSRWDGALKGALYGLGAAFNADLAVTLVSGGFGVIAGDPGRHCVCFAGIREVPELYLVMTAFGLVWGGVTDQFLPDWVEVAMPAPGGVPGPLVLGIRVR